MYTFISGLMIDGARRRRGWGVPGGALLPLTPRPGPRCFLSLNGERLDEEPPSCLNSWRVLAREGMKKKKKC